MWNEPETRTRSVFHMASDRELEWSWLNKESISHSYLAGAWTALAQRTPSVSDPRLLVCRRLIATRSELLVEGAGPAWRLHLEDTQHSEWNGHAVHRTMTNGKAIQCKMPVGLSVMGWMRRYLTLQEVCLDGVSYKFPVDAGRFVGTKQTFQPPEKTCGWICHF